MAKHRLAEFKAGNKLPQGRKGYQRGFNPANRAHADYDLEVRPKQLPAKERLRADYKVGRN